MVPAFKLEILMRVLGKGRVCRYAGLIRRWSY